MTKEIRLTQGRVALVDDEDYEWLNQWKWYYSNGYAQRHDYLIDKTILMHREILHTPDGMDTDHADGIRWNNQRHNLRTCTRSQNMMNSPKQKDNQSGYKGVSWRKDARKWEAKIMANGQQNHIGYFNTAEEASQEYDKATIQYHGNFACPNQKG